MKKLVMLLMLFACTSSSPVSEEPVTIQIMPIQGGFEIYSASGELLLEFTPQDSADVELLKYIHEVALDFERNPEKWENPEYEPPVRGKQVELASRYF